MASGANLTSRLGQVSRDTIKYLERAVGQTCVDIEREAKASLEGPRSGRIYQRGTVTHQASAPGEAPATDLGNLKNSIRSSSAGLKGQVEVNAEYGSHLEFGTTRMEARPFLRPAVIRVEPQFEKRCAAAVRKGSEK